MNYAVGHAICTSEMFRNFKYKKLDMKCKDSLKLTNKNDREPYVCRIFRNMFAYIIQDIIENNIIFQLPTGKKHCEIYMDRITGEDFKNFRQKGKWKGLDILTSNFSGYQLLMDLGGISNGRKKPIYLNKELRDRIIEKSNNGDKMLGYKYKEAKDYIDKAKELFPGITKHDLKLILNYGLRVMYMMNSFGVDTLITDQTTWIYTGYLMKDSIKYFHYYKNKMIKKLRLLYKMKGIQWDGYYYFAIGKKQYEEVTSQQKTRGRKKKIFNYGKIRLFKIFDECNLSEFEDYYVYKVPMPVDFGFSSIRDNFTTKNAELILERQPLKFKDILLENKNYKYL